MHKVLIDRPIGKAIMLSDRVADLIKKRFRGNVSAAARACDLSQPALHDIAKGITRNPSSETLDKLARGLRVPVAELLGDEEQLSEAPPPVPTQGNTVVIGLEARLSQIDRDHEDPFLRMLERENLSATYRAASLMANPIEAEAARLRLSIIDRVTQQSGAGRPGAWAPGEATRLLHEALRQGQPVPEGAERLRPTG